VGIGFAVVLQLAAINFAPLVVVQPLGVVALIVGALLSSRMTRRRLARGEIHAVVLSSVGVGVFVVSSAMVVTNATTTAGGALATLTLGAGVVGIALITITIARQKLTAIVAVCAAGVLYGFVAVYAKVLLSRLRTDALDPINLATIAGLIASLLLGLYFVHTAHSLGSPALVIAGLTVVDPIVAIALSTALLGEGGEALNAAPWILLIWAASASVAIVGVAKLSRHHALAHDIDVGVGRPTRPAAV